MGQWYGGEDLYYFTNKGWDSTNSSLKNNPCYLCINTYDKKMHGSDAPDNALLIKDQITQNVIPEAIGWFKLTKYSESLGTTSDNIGGNNYMS